MPTAQEIATWIIASWWLFWFVAAAWALFMFAAVPIWLFSTMRSLRTIARHLDAPTELAPRAVDDDARAPYRAPGQPPTPSFGHQLLK